MPKWGERLWELKWQIFAAGLLIFGLLMVKGGLAALGPFMKFAVPVAVAAYAFKFVKQKVMASAGHAIRKKFEDALRQGMQGPQGPQGSTTAGARPRRDDKVIDLCPKCGSYLAPGHRCKT